MGFVSVCVGVGGRWSGGVRWRVRVRGRVRRRGRGRGRGWGGGRGGISPHASDQGEVGSIDGAVKIEVCGVQYYNIVLLPLTTSFVHNY